VAHQILNSRRSVGKNDTEVRLRHAQVCKLGQAFGHGLVKAQLTTLDQDHSSGCDERLGHGKDAPHCVGLQSVASRHVAEADRTLERDAVPSADRDRRSGDCA
jgi:hypothetical protein